MIGQSMFEVMIPGQVSTNSNREMITSWRSTLERLFASLHVSNVQRSKISVELRFWLAPERLYGLRRNDLDNLAKPVLDAMKRIGIIQDDADIFRLEITKFPTNGEEGVYVRVRDWN